MKKTLLLLATLTAILTVVTSFAQDLQAQISLTNLVAQKLSERSFDQVYVGITDASAGKAFKYHRLPNFPLHWVMKKNAQINNQILWTGTVKAGETVTLQFTLGEQDTSRFDVDDLIGMAQVDLINEQGQLKTTWSVPKEPKAAAVTSRQIDPAGKYEFSGDHSNYQAQFTATPVTTPAQPGKKN